MGWKNALSDIVTQPGTRLRFSETLAKHTYFGIGGEADAYLEVSTVAELAELARFHQQWKVPVAIIGRGSNLLVSDAGFRGIAVRLIGELAQLEIDKNIVSVGAGLALPRLSKVMSKNGLSGAEFCARHTRGCRWRVNNERRRVGKQFWRTCHGCDRHGRDRRRERIEPGRSTV